MLRVSLILVGHPTHPRLGVGDVIPPVPHPAATAVLNPDIQVEQHIEGPDDVEPPALGSMGVRRFLIPAHHHSLATRTI